MKSRAPRTKAAKADEKQLEELLQQAATLQASRSGSSAKRKPRPAAPRKSQSIPACEEIALRAYHIYLERGASHGLDWADWFQAEKELRSTGQAGQRRRYSQARG